MDNVTLSPVELGAVVFVVALCGALVYRMHSKTLDALVGKESPLRELTVELRALNAKVETLTAELVGARRDRGDPTPVTAPSSPYAIHNRRGG